MSSYVGPAKFITLPSVEIGTTTPKPLEVYQSGGLVVGATESTLALTGTTVIIEGEGRVGVVSVITTGTVAGALYDAASTTVTSAEQIGVVAAATGYTVVDFPVSNGLVVAPGAGQTISLSYATAL